MTHYLIDNQPEEWEQLAVIYDKDGEYKQKYIESKMRQPNATESTSNNSETEANEQSNVENKTE